MVEKIFDPICNSDSKYEKVFFVALFLRETSKLLFFYIFKFRITESAQESVRFFLNGHRDTFL